MYVYVDTYIYIYTHVIIRISCKSVLGIPPIKNPHLNIPLPHALVAHPLSGAPPPLEPPRYRIGDLMVIGDLMGTMGFHMANIYPLVN